MAVQVESFFTLNDFIFKMMKLPREQSNLEEIVKLFCGLKLQNELIEEHLHFSTSAYTRNLLCRTPKFDMLVLCWKPGQETTIHDHAGSINVTRVFKGELTSKVFSVREIKSDKIFIKQSLEERMNTNSYVSLDREGIHQLSNTSDSDLVTVHLYSPPLKQITVYKEDGSVELTTLRYTLEDELVG